MSKKQVTFVYFVFHTLVEVLPSIILGQNPFQAELVYILYNYQDVNGELQSHQLII